MTRFWGNGCKPGDWVALDRESLSHAKVIRLREGEHLELINGKGDFWRGYFEKRGVRVLESGTASKISPEIMLAVGVTEGGTFDLIVRQAVEMGVGKVIPLITKWSAPRLDQHRAASKLTRWNKVIDEACKQSGLYWRPTVQTMTTIGEVLRDSGAAHVVGALGSQCIPWKSLDLSLAKRVIAWIGPRGDFAPDEYAILKDAEVKFVSLGPAVLRVETACVSIISSIRAMLG